MLHGRFDIGGNNQQEKDDQHPSGWHPSSRYQQANRSHYFGNTGGIYQRLLIRDKVRHHHNHASCERNVTNRRKYQHGGHTDPGRQINIPLVGGVKQRNQRNRRGHKQNE